MRKLTHVVTGTGRCGTVYLSRLLTSLGIPCGHESIFSFDGISQAAARLEGRLKIRQSLCSETTDQPPLDDLVADASYMAAPFLRSNLCSSAKIIHLVRHPLKVVNSFINGLNYFQHARPVWAAKGDPQPDLFHEFIYRHVPELKQAMDPVSRACLYFTRWNQIIEANMPPTGVRIRLEDCPTQVFKELGLNPADCYNSKDANKSSYEKILGLTSIARGPIRDEFLSLAERYGYKLESRVML